MKTCDFVKFFSFLFFNSTGSSVVNNVSVNKGTRSCSFIYALSKDAFALQWQSLETVSPRRLQYLLCLFTEKVCEPSLCLQFR